MKNYSLIVMMMLVLLQSLSGFADVHQYEQSDREHISLTNEQSPQDRHVDGCELDDCQHCCHCHGSICSLVVSHSQLFELPPLSSAVSPYHSNSPPKPLKSVYRPPIA